MKIAIQMDNFDQINFATDSTMLLVEEAQKRGMKIYSYHPSSLILYDGKVYANASLLHLSLDKEVKYTLKEQQLIALDQVDVILVRQDPPFDMAYITACYLLEYVSDKVLIINNPKSVRDCPEKLFVCSFPQLMPPTLISGDKQMIEDFVNEHEEIVIKPIYSHGGQDIFHFKAGDNNLAKVVDILLRNHNHQLIAQKFIPEVKVGDKRIILWNGKAVGQLLRTPPEGTIVSNMAAGGKASKTDLNERDLEICSVIGPELVKRGLYLAGIDIIGGFVTEINVTSPTGLRAIKNLYDLDLACQIWDDICQMKA